MPFLQNRNNNIDFIIRDKDYWEYDFPNLTKIKPTIDIIINDILPKFYKLDNHIFLFKSGTGSGKSSVFIHSLFNYCVKNFKNKGILLTQPRIALVENKISDWELYYNDTFKLGVNFGTKTSKQENKISYKYPSIFTCTTEIFNNMYIKDKSILERRFKYIIIDEVHEPSIEIIMALKYIKDWNLSKSKDIPYFILMSATLDENAFTEYYGLVNGLNGVIVSEPVVDVKKNYIEHFLNDSILPIRLQDEINKTLYSCFLKNISNYLETSCRDIIIFAVSNINNIYRQIINYIKNDKIMSDLIRKYNIMPIVILYTRNNLMNRTEEKINVGNLNFFYKDTESLDLEFKKKSIKIIISTNILESGATLPNLRFCIDTGYKKQAIPYLLNKEPVSKLNLTTTIIDKNNFIQRKGRIGRIEFGEFYGLYSKDISENFNLKEIPNIYIDATLKTNLKIFNFYNKNLEYSLNWIDFLSYKCFDSIIYNNPLHNSDFIFKLSPEIINYMFIKLYKCSLTDKYGNLTIYNILINDGNLTSFIKLIMEIKHVNIFDINLFISILNNFMEYDTIDNLFNMYNYNFGNWLSELFNYKIDPNIVIDINKFLILIVENYKNKDNWKTLFLNIFSNSLDKLNYYSADMSQSIFLNNYKTDKIDNLLDINKIL